MASRAEVDRRTVEEAVAVSTQMLGEALEGDHIVQDAVAAEAERELTPDEERRERSEEKLRLQRLEVMLRETLEVMKASGAQGVAGHVASDMERKLQLAKIEGIVQRGGFAKVLVHPTSNPNETWEIDLGMNGSHVKVRRGIAQRIPVKFLMCLELAEKVDYAPVVVNGQPLIQEQRVPSYPYTLIDVQPQQ